MAKKTKGSTAPVIKAPHIQHCVDCIKRRKWGNGCKSYEDPSVFRRRLDGHCPGFAQRGGR